jgi:hypothetical protein
MSGTLDVSAAATLTGEERLAAVLRGETKVEDVIAWLGEEKPGHALGAPARGGADEDEREQFVVVLLNYLREQGRSGSSSTSPSSSGGPSSGSPRRQRASSISPAVPLTTAIGSGNSNGGGEEFASSPPTQQVIARNLDHFFDVSDDAEFPTLGGTRAGGPPPPQKQQQQQQRQPHKQRGKRGRRIKPVSVDAKTAQIDRKFGQAKILQVGVRVYLPNPSSARPC